MAGRLTALCVVLAFALGATGATSLSISPTESQDDECRAAHADETSCDADVKSGGEGCVWCKSVAVKSSCYTIQNAAKLPGGVFECDAPPAPPAKAACQFNTDCGPQLGPNHQIQVNGICLSNGTCTCYSGWSCDDCSRTTYNVTHNGTCPPRTSHIKVPIGDASCSSDAQCFNGDCVSGKCNCTTGWVCGQCELTEAMVSEGQKCFPAVPVGGKACKTGDDCSSGDGACDNSACRCYDGYFCDDCSLDYPELINGKTCGQAPFGSVRLN